MELTHFLMVPWTGLGLYNGFRGNAWLKNRIQIFKQFVLPSLLAQSNKDFVLWCCWRREERNNPLVKEYVEFMEGAGIKCVHTFSGIPMWDDKHSDEVARERYIMAVHGALPALFDYMKGETILVTIQPSDDCYINNFVEGVQKRFKEMPDMQALGFRKGYIMNYQSLEVSEYNPLTIPPFFTIKFPREIFIDPREHVDYASYKSHEYVAQKLRFGEFMERGFLVGTHLNNISTTYKHPFKGAIVKDILESFGLKDIQPLKVPVDWHRAILHRLPHRIQRKLRYWWSEKLKL